MFLISVPLNASAIEARWAVPKIANGVIIRYRLYVDENISSEGTMTRAVVGNLTPYT